MKRLILALTLLALTATQALSTGFELPNPAAGPMVYSDCPQPVVWTASVGMVLMVPTIIIGTVAGALSAPFYGEYGFIAGIYSGAVVGNLIGTAITGAPAYGIYRLFNWGGCKKTQGD